MFSKEDYIKYLLQIQEIELAMYSRFQSYASAVDDPKLKKFFTDLQNQERAHNKIVKDMLTSFDYSSDTPAL